MRADHLVCGSGYRQRQKFGDEIAAEPHGMAALARETRDADQREREVRARASMVLEATAG